VLLALAAALAAGRPAAAEVAPHSRAPAAEDPSALCDRAAEQAARETGVPLAVLRAIALTESGRRRDGRLRPWPWTVNMEGAGAWFDTADAALAYVNAHHARGARSFDVGCFQVNFRWHGHAFASLEEMLHPLANARYAARFLADLHAAFGDWSRAAGAYHSRTPEHAERYRRRFDALLARVAGGADPVAPGPEAADGWTGPTPATGLADPDPRSGPAAPAGPPPRVNAFPLLLAGGAPGSLGSLVPADARGSGPLLGPAAGPLLRDAADAL
jgi:hypothetical protein